MLELSDTGFKAAIIKKMLQGTLTNTPDKWKKRKFRQRNGVSTQKISYKE